MSETRPRPLPTGVEKFKRDHVSPEGRERLSQLATQRHRDGGFQKSSGGGKSKPRKTAKRRVSEKVAQAAREKRNAEAIIDVFRDGVHPNQPMTTRLKAAEAWIRVEQEDAKLKLKEESEQGQRHDRAELLEMLSSRLTEGHSAMLLRKQLAERADISDVIEGTVMESEEE